jgi:hypothetical protein
MTIPSVSTASAATYDVVVTTGGGPTNSQPAVLTALTPPAQGSLTYGLVLHLQFDSNYMDSSGWGNAVTPNGSPTFVPGKIGGAAVQVSSTNGTTFNSVSANLLNTLAFNDNDNFSVSLWVSYTGNYNDLPWIGNARNSTYQTGWVMTGDTTSGVNCGLENSIAGVNGPLVLSDPVPNSPTLNDGNWHHVVMAVDRANAIVVSYADGTPFNTTSISTLAGYSLATGLAVTIGSDPTTEYTGWNGVPATYNIDDVGIWNRVLSAAEVNSIYTLGESGQTYNQAIAVQLTIQIVGTKVQIGWSSGTLQSAPTLNGPWTAVPGATIPSYQATPSGTATFYRVQL